MERFSIFSDGGGEKGSSAAGSCIVRDGKSGTEYRVAAFLGGATNNESEIFGGLLGFAVVRALAGAGGGAAVRWVSDSEYLLKSATGYINQWQRNGWKTAAKQPVKNQGLWRAYLALSQGITITAEHVYGHNGHPENEACDEACTWVRQNVGKSLRMTEGGIHFDIDAAGFEEGWRLVDGQAILEALRETNPDKTAIENLAEIVGGSVLSGAAADSSGAAAKRAETMLWSRLHGAVKAAEEAAAKIKDPDGAEIGQVLSRLAERAASRLTK